MPNIVSNLDGSLDGNLEDILHPTLPPPSANGRQLLGNSREGRDIFGYRLGRGAERVSLIAGCHADEPVGPAMLDRLISFGQQHPKADWLERYTLFVVPHANPDGEARNAAWTDPMGDAQGWTAADCVVDLPSYLRHVVREVPGEDMEFGFPRAVSPEDAEDAKEDTAARPENRAIAEFLAATPPYRLHGSFHGMALAAGPWFLIEQAWIDRSLEMRQTLRQQVRRAGYSLHDIDRQGEKGFHRIDEGFTTRPDSRAMAAHFNALDQPETAALFRPSSMEFVRSLGGDPLTLVSEMPLFLVPQEQYLQGDLLRPPAVTELLRQSFELDDEALRAAAAAAGIQPMPLRDQMAFQLRFLSAALACVGKQT